MPSIVNITLTSGREDDWQSANQWRDPHKRAAMFTRFWSHVNRRSGSACWQWTGTGNGRGYGTFPIGSRRIMAHRFAWLASRGDIPEGQDVCHRCDNPGCVNPDHLFLGTHRENLLDSVRKGRKRAWGQQKLNAEQVIEIRQRCAAGERQRDVAMTLGIARNTVSQIVTRKTWAHLDTEVAHG
jgi:hypothetical protein